MKEFGFSIVDINKEEIIKFTSSDEFMQLGFELTKEITCFLIMVAGLSKADEKNKKIALSRNDAIILGLMIRLMKLYQSFLDNVRQRHFEIVVIISRCIVETAVNIIYLLDDINDKKFDDYILYSLCVEKDFLEHIEKNIKERGHELNIETRMKTSIDRSFLMSGIEITDIQKKKMLQWQRDGIFGRFKKIDMQGFYSLYSLLCHSAHGNWQDLLFYNLEKEGDMFYGKYDWTTPDLRGVLPYNLIILDVCKRYLAFFDKDFFDTQISYIEDAAQRIRTLNDLHEAFIVGS